MTRGPIPVRCACGARIPAFSRAGNCESCRPKNTSPGGDGGSQPAAGAGVTDPTEAALDELVALTEEMGLYEDGTR